MMRQLLPPNRTPLQAALADSSALNIDPTPLRHIADASRCPAALLPWLAWARSVDGWDEAMAEQPRRELVRQSFAIHKRAGTAGAVRRAMAALGVAVEFKEWQSMPGAAPYTFGLVAWVNDNPANESAVLTPQLYDRLKRLVDQTRNERSHYALKVGARFDQAMKLASASKAAAVGRWGGEAKPVQPRQAVQLLQMGSAAQLAASCRRSATPLPVQPAAAVQALGIANAIHTAAVCRCEAQPQAVQPRATANAVTLAGAARGLSVLRVSMEV
jgi:phage tail P2-like protein